MDAELVEAVARMISPRAWGAWDTLCAHKGYTAEERSIELAERISQRPEMAEALR